MAGLLILSGALSQYDQAVDTDWSQTRLQKLGQVFFSWFLEKKMWTFSEGHHQCWWVLTSFHSQPQVQKGMRKEVSVLIPVNAFHRRKGFGLRNQQVSPLNIPHNASIDIMGPKMLQTVLALLLIHVSHCSSLKSHTLVHRPMLDVCYSPAQRAALPNVLSPYLDKVLGVLSALQGCPCFSLRQLACCGHPELI